MMEATVCLLLHLLLLVFLLTPVTAQPPPPPPLTSTIPPLDPTRIAVVTVLDPSNAEVVRDALSMVRSLRLHGGALNDATLLVCVTVDDSSSPSPSSAVLPPLSLPLYELARAGVELAFIRQVPGHLPKTLNKLDALALAWDTLRFDYVLWLDADIVVFGDPLATGHLQRHAHPGQVDCVPDFYSYLRRFPHVNATDLVWNPALPTWFLLGDGEVAPHGTCNTGVLFFDTQTLRALLDEVPQAMDAIDRINPFKWDRFLDSLYFVAAINRGGIRAHIMAYDMNYMAFFEQETAEERIPVGDVVFMHFLSNATMYCELSPSPSPSPSLQQQHAIADPTPRKCDCLYYTDMLTPPNSVVLKKVRELLQDGVCGVMAGAIPPPAIRAAPPMPDEWKPLAAPADLPPLPQQQQKQHPDGTCAGGAGAVAVRGAAVLWPPQPGSVIHVSTATDDVAIEHRLQLLVEATCAAQGGAGTSDTGPGVENGSNDDGDVVTIDTEVWVVPPDYTHSAADPFVPDFSRAHNASSEGRRVHQQAMVLTQVAPRRSATDGNGNDNGNVGEPLAVAFRSVVRLPSDIFIDPSGKLRLSVRHTVRAGPVADVAVAWTGAVEVTAVVDARVSRGVTAYAPNLLLGATPLALRTQAALPEFLHAHTLGGTGAALCCDTAAGVAAVEGVIARWRGEFFVVMVAAVPPTSTGSVEDLAAHLRGRCGAGATPLRCVVLALPAAAYPGAAEPGEAQRRGYGPVFGRAMRPRAVSFFYTDVYVDYTSYGATLAAWFPALADHGLLIGSQFDGVGYPRGSAQCVPGAAGCGSPDQFRVERGYAALATNVFTAVESFADAVAQAYLVTYDEPPGAARGWYMFKSPTRLRP
jgi:hypothetical protein